MSKQTAANRAARWLGIALFPALFSGYLCLSVPRMAAQSAQNPAPQTDPTQSSQTPSAQGIPDAPSTVQPPSATPEPPPIPKPEEKKPVERDPWTNQPIKPAGTDSGTAPGDEASTPPPPMPPVTTVPPGTTKKPGPSAQDQLYTLVVHTNFVQLPVTVKDKSTGRTVDGLLPADFSVYENNVKQKLTYFTADPFALSVAIVLDTGMSDASVQEINQTFPALVGAFAPYDEVSLYTFSSTVSQVSDFTGATQKLSALLTQMKTERGKNNGAPVLGGPLAQNGPIINGVPVGSPTAPVNTPPKEARVLNDAILRAALDLSKRPRVRRKIILVISDGREYGSQASYRDVLRLLLSNEIEVRAVAVGSAAVPVYNKLERLRLPKQGYSDILPKYTAATGGGAPYTSITRSAIADTYAEAMSEARNQYTLGYTPARPKTPTTSAYRTIEVRVDHPGLKIEAKDGYYPVPVAR